MPEPIEHVVALQLENHSFDQMMGALTAVYPDLDGVWLGKESANYGLVVNQPKSRSLMAYGQRMTDERGKRLPPSKRCTQTESEERRLRTATPLGANGLPIARTSGVKNPKQFEKADKHCHQIVLTSVFCLVPFFCF